MKSVQRFLTGLVPILVSLLFMAGCNHNSNVITEKSVIEEKVHEFHKDFNDFNFERIYNDAHPELKKVFELEEYIRFMTFSRDLLGPAKTSTNQEWNKISEGSSSLISLSQETQFENGTTSEIFHFLSKRMHWIYRMHTDGRADMSCSFLKSPVSSY